MNARNVCVFSSDGVFGIHAMTIFGDVVGEERARCLGLTNSWASAQINSVFKSVESTKRSIEDREAGETWLPTLATSPTTPVSLLRLQRA